MKRGVLFLLSLYITLSGYSQTPKLWGVTSSGGSNNWGTVYNMNIDGSGHTVIHNFDFTYGGTPKGSLVQASDGNLYGTCYDGGAFGSCTVYRIDPSTGIFTHLWDMGSGVGSVADYPEGGMVEYDGGLFGFAGVIYRWDIALGTPSDAYTLQPGDGSGYLIGEPLLVGSKIYGVATGGGLYNAGTLFVYDIAADTFDVLHDFTLATGYVPYAGVTMGKDGNLYGLCQSGGANSVGINTGGVIFRYNLTLATYEVLFDFSVSEGDSPRGKLIQNPNGLFYGLTETGGAYFAGTIYSYDPITDNHEILHSFEDANGSYPNGHLTRIGNKLFGTTPNGGSMASGTIFSFDLETEVFTKIKDLDAISGVNPTYGGLVTSDFSDVGIETENAQIITVYPTISSGSITINKSGLGNFNLFDLAGNLVFSQYLTENQTSIELNLTSGLYIYTYTLGEESAEGKIIIR